MSDNTREHPFVVGKFSAPPNVQPRLDSSGRLTWLLVPQEPVEPAEWSPFDENHQLRDDDGWTRLGALNDDAGQQR